MCEILANSRKSHLCSNWYIAPNAKGEEKQYTVTLEGSFKNNTLSIKFTPVYGGMPATIVMIATFEATKK